MIRIFWLLICSIVYRGLDCTFAITRRLFCVICSSSLLLYMYGSFTMKRIQDVAVRRLDYPIRNCIVFHTHCVFVMA
ncbi:hypothetical protein EV127DRAFT_441134 [Xylaria flabelliformis]|nr:hypothetical protein EV127DRAFT_441134 [Xylaria flabelliformis]